MCNRILFLLWVALFSTLVLCAQPSIAWQRNYGGSFPDRCHSIVVTEDGGYVLLAYTASSDGDVFGFQGFSDIWVLKLDHSGALQWQRCLGGTGPETAGEIAQTPDGGYILVGGTASTDGDVSQSLGGNDIWVVRLSAGGMVLWERSYGGADNDVGVSVSIRSDGGFLVLGHTDSMDGNSNDNHGLADFWLGQIDEEGVLMQSRCYGGTGTDAGRTMRCFSDGAVILGGVTNSIDGDVVGNTRDSHEAWIVYLSNGWDITWQTALGGGAEDQVFGLYRTIDDMVVAAIVSNSDEGDITEPWGEYDYWVVKLGNDGSLLEQRSLGGSGQDLPRGIGSADGGQTMYLVGSSTSNDGLVSSPNGGSDVWLVYLSADLDLLWERSFGGSGGDGGNALCFASDGGLVIGGLTSSSDGDATGTNGSTDVWVVKLEPQDVGMGAEVLQQSLRLFPNPATNMLNIQWDDEVRSLTVHDTQGKLVASVDRLPTGLRQHQLNVEAWADGLYTVQLNGTGKRQVQRFAKH